MILNANAFFVSIQLLLCSFYLFLLFGRDISSRLCFTLEFLLISSFSVSLIVKNSLYFAVIIFGCIVGLASGWLYKNLFLDTGNVSKTH